MSWSITVLGKPEAIIKALDEHSGTLTGQSKEEYDEAKPYLQGLVALAVGEGPMVKVIASGHALFKEGQKTDGSIHVSITQEYIKLAL